MGTNLLGGQDLLPLTLIGKKLVGTSPPSPRFFIRSGGSDYSQEMHNYKYISLHISWLLKVYRCVLTKYFFSMMATHKFKKEWTDLFIFF